MKCPLCKCKLPPIELTTIFRCGYGQPEYNAKVSMCKTNDCGFAYIKVLEPTGRCMMDVNNK